MERAEYLNSHPGDALLGVGMIHEESNHNKFSFRLGTMNSSFKYGRCMIESNDIAWCPILLRFGYIGVMLFFLYLLIIVMACNSLIKSCDNKNVYLDSIMIYMISVLILTFNRHQLLSYKYIIKTFQTLMAVMFCSIYSLTLLVHKVKQFMNFFQTL